MNLNDAVRFTEILMAFAFILQSIEHLKSFPGERFLYFSRLVFAVLLFVGYQTAWVTMSLLVLGLAALYRFQGPYNGGADRMSLLILCSLCLVHLAPGRYWQEIVFAYLALQLVLSYFISGWVKVKNPDWRNGRALTDVFQFSVYPVSESVRQWFRSPQLLVVMSWNVMLFELLFPFALYSRFSLYLALLIAISFHFANACLFGLNRFFWIWISAYPSLIWFQSRITQPGLFE